MRTFRLRRLACSSACAAAVVACSTLDLFAHPPKPKPLTPFNTPGGPPALGQMSDVYFRQQEVNGEASDFVLYDHEFQDDSIRLTVDGEDHLRQIAARIGGTPFPVIVERTTTSTSAPDDPFHYPVHPNPDLDRKRRAAVVKLLQVMNVADAGTRVLVAPSPTMTMLEHDIKNANRMLENRNMNNYGMGRGGSGFGGLFY